MTREEIVRAMTKNADDCVRLESYFKDAVGGLSDRRRRIAFDYVRLLQDRINLLEQLRVVEAGE